MKIFKNNKNNKKYTIEFKYTSYPTLTAKVKGVYFHPYLWCGETIFKHFSNNVDNKTLTKMMLNYVKTQSFIEIAYT